MQRELDKTNHLVITDDELFYIQKAVTLLDIERKNQKDYDSDDKEFHRQLIVKLLSIKY